jgi:hypothetical protein
MLIWQGAGYCLVDDVLYCHKVFPQVFFQLR